MSSQAPIDARWVAPVALALLVAACGAPAPEPETAPPAAPEVEAVEALPEAQTLPQAPPAANRLLGLEPRHVQIILGTPSLVRREGAAQVMQFKNGNCVFDVTFYEEAPGGAFLARHLASRLLDGAPIAPDDCLAAILPGGRFPPGTLPELPPVVAPEVVPEIVEESAAN